MTSSHKHPPVQPGKIPVLFDIVERGEFAPAENRIQPPSENSAFYLDGSEPDSEDPTVLPGPHTADGQDSTMFNLDELEDTTQEMPIIPASMLEGDSTEFTLPPSEATAEEVQMAAPATLEITEQDKNDLVDQVLQKLKPQLEELAEETLQNFVGSSKEGKDSDQKKG